MKDFIKMLEKWDLPYGFTVALGENPDAVKAFVNLPKERREDYIERAVNADSKAELHRIASDLASTGFNDFIG